MTDDDKRYQEETVFLACTRPPMFLGVTMDAFGFIAIGTMLIYLLGNSLLYLSVGVVLWAICRVLCKYDPNIFRVLSRWADTRARAMSARYWGGSSAAPLRFTRLSERDLRHDG